jgi:hypothetical protein
MNTSNKHKAESLKKYYEGTTDARASNIRAILTEAVELKIEFPNLTRLSEYTAHKLAIKEGSPVSGSTIRRNDKYKSLLIDFFILMNPEKMTTKKDKAIADSLVARTFAIEAKKQELQITELKKQLAESEVLLSKRLGLELTEKHISQSTRVEQISSSSDETCEDLYPVLYRSFEAQGGIEFNITEGVIYDAAEDEVIMTKKAFPKFFEWLALNTKV